MALYTREDVETYAGEVEAQAAALRHLLALAEGDNVDTGSNPLPPPPPPPPY